MRTRCLRITCNGYETLRYEGDSAGALNRRAATAATGQDLARLARLLRVGSMPIERRKSRSLPSMRNVGSAALAAVTSAAAAVEDRDDSERRRLEAPRLQSTTRYSEYPAFCSSRRLSLMSDESEIASISASPRPWSSRCSFSSRVHRPRVAIEPKPADYAG